MSNVNNLNGIPNFGHGDLIPKEGELLSIDEVKESSETEVVVKPHKAKVKSAAQKAFGGKY